MRRQLLPALGMLVVFTILTGALYPLLVTGIAQVAFPNQANGSSITRDGVVVGSSLVGQAFTSPGYFHPRPSAIDYKASASGASQLGPTNPDLLAAVQDRAIAYRAENGLAPGALVPVDAVTASGSGLDPLISVANATLQAPRVAKARGLDLARVLDLVRANTVPRAFGFLGEPGVNVLRLNIAVDEASAG
jgi:K+-transporting ATPase ATPase C chain